MRQTLQESIKIQSIMGLLFVTLTFLLAACSPGEAATPSPTPPAATPLPTQVEAAPATATPTATPTVQPAVSPISPVATPVADSVNGQIQSYAYQIINTYPHDREAFTQGLVYVDGQLYEGTGLYGRSTLRKVDLESGQVQQRHKLPLGLFGEGITIFGDKLYQLTWKAGRGFVYDKDTFELLHEFSYPTQGWGITHDGQKLIMSDGSDTLYFWDPETLAEIGQVKVFDDKGPVVRLNELEFIDGQVYANVWQTNTIVIINPGTGRVTGRVNLGGLLTTEDLSQPVDVLNGIFYIADTERLFVTGKLWPKLFEIELIPLN